jgi:hypothetical protein
MSPTSRTTNPVDVHYHPVSHYACPADVLTDSGLSAAEKRVILSSWASDMYAVESNPALREIPGSSRRMRLSDILSALRELDSEDQPPPRGGAAMRAVPYTTLNARSRPLEAVSANQGTRRPNLRPASVRLTAGARWTHEANVQRYRKLLATRLTDNERRFVERRLAEELQALNSPSQRRVSRIAS